MLGKYILKIYLCFIIKQFGIMQLIIGGLKVSQNVLRELHAKAKATKQSFILLCEQYVFEIKAKRNEKNSINPIS